MLGQARRVDGDLVGDAAPASPARAPRARRCRRRSRATTCSAVPSSRLNTPGHGAAALQVDQRVGQRQVVLADVFVVAPHVGAELGPVLREVVGGPAQAAKVTFMKSGERPIMPQVARAQCSIIFAAGFQLLAGPRDDEGAARPARRWSATRRSSPRAAPGRAACRRATAMARPRRRRPGWVVTSLTRSPPSQTSRGWSRKPCRYSRPVRAGMTPRVPGDRYPSSQTFHSSAAGKCSTPRTFLR